MDASALQLVVSDGRSGLPAARATKLPQAKQQRGVGHKIRGLERAFCYRNLTTTDPIRQERRTHEAARRLRRPQLTTEAHAIVAAPTRAEAEARLAQFRMPWGTLEPEVVRLLSKDVDAGLTFYQCDQSLHALIRSTNLLERFFREFRTKADEIGSFPNEMSCLVVFHLIVIRDDAKHNRGQTAKTR